MDAAALDIDTSHDPVDWTALNAAVDRWRGALIRRFAEAETAVSETLVTLQSVPKRGKTIVLPHLTGQRFEQLALAIAEAGPFGAEGKAGRAALAAFRSHENLRPLLCHGKAKVTADRRGHWQLRLDMLHFSAVGKEHRRHVVDQQEAHELLSTIGSATQRLTSLLGQLRRAIET
ncbi:hypothetical protein Q5H91_02705 [Sphingomonas sp. KR1UV-12]|uniref:Uncharacterized protein n=1 Tax=Sphingomonas aurea TaxID=3063994 RepID=A0ABT9EGL6_9SPHN|nr:hypothetical protein [Sphingomonas sp. KR1UV-12]MDP1026109.1 hypothetical protein [Sphingomonas sp. KR1UV-12]